MSIITMYMKVLKIRLATVILIFCLCLTAYSTTLYFKKFTFDEDKALDNWNKMVLNGEVDYMLMKAGNGGYVKAFSEKACSALYHRVGFKLEKYPFFKWKWRVLQFPDISSAATDKEKDDYAARVYVIFPFLNFSSSKFLEYAWAEDIPAETVMDSPFGDNVKIIIIRSGMPPEEGWIGEIRNVYKDYVKVFGKEPERNVGAIAIMCDADSTKTTAEALFDDITIEYPEGSL